MGKVRGFPGTPVVEQTDNEHEPDETEQMQKASDKSWSNSSAELMNEGEDEGWRESWERQKIEDRKGNSSEDKDD